MRAGWAAALTLIAAATTASAGARADHRDTPATHAAGGPASATGARDRRDDAAPITEVEVHAFMEALAEAARRRDVAALGAMLADDCRIELRARIGGREQLTTFTKAEYVRMLGSGYAAMRDLQRYDYRIEDVQVTVAPDGSAADARARVLETAVLQGVTMVTRSDERSRLERRDGRLAFVRVSATTEAAAQR